MSEFEVQVMGKLMELQGEIGAVRETQAAQEVTLKQLVDCNKDQADERRNNKGLLVAMGTALASLGVSLFGIFRGTGGN